MKNIVFDFGNVIITFDEDEIISKFTKDPKEKEFLIKNKIETTKKDFEKDDVAFQEYEKALAEYKSLHGSKFMEVIKRKIVKISACFIPGRYNRSVYRRWLKKKFDLK